MTWEGAISSLPRQIKWIHHGRNPRTGLDCVGLILCVYSLRGIDISHLDVPYGIRDYKRRPGLLVERLKMKFKEVSDFADGDVIVTPHDNCPSHLAIVIGERVYQMTAQGLWIYPKIKAKWEALKVFRSE